MAQAVFCLARTEAQAIRIVDQLKAAGFSHNDISVLFPDKAGTRDLRTNSTPKPLKGPRPGLGRGACWAAPSAGWWGLAPSRFLGSAPSLRPVQLWPPSAGRPRGPRSGASPAR